MVLASPARRRAAVFAGSALLTTGLAFTLSACADGAPPAGGQSAVSLRLTGASLAGALEAQATAVERQPGPKVCTTDPADRAACRNPGGTIDPRGGDLDGDGVFEPHEPVGPGYKDPRAYDGGRTSGETQCEWLRSQGKAC
ncbi:hypothetical protein [Streptomyces sp. CB03238]|uniref:hypothetical protein n=1 Tax=Streptomyces sp. CB03238 TaxID=1907777 RepID=UPI000A108D45|nr:hypothetical protein [Streptomyces sp. CB03238]ORT57023.1 hypothetical protein BKD26_25690 [Streptomyces sp. CB03238]